MPIVPVSNKLGAGAQIAGAKTFIEVSHILLCWELSPFGSSSAPPMRGIFIAAEPILSPGLQACNGFFTQPARGCYSESQRPWIT
jgi:hypothetical protein